MKLKLSLILLLLAAMPSFSQVKKSPSAAGLSDISKLDVVCNSGNYKEVYDVFTIGGNTLKIPNPGFTKINKRQGVFIDKNNKTERFYLNEYFYSEKYKILATLWNDDVDYGYLRVFDCVNGKVLKEVDVFYRSPYSNFSMSPDSSKLLYKKNDESFFTILDLSDMTETTYDMFPYDPCVYSQDYCDAGFIRDDIIYCTVKYTEEGDEKNKICFYRVKDGKYTRLSDFIPIPRAYYYWKISGFKYVICADSYWHSTEKNVLAYDKKKAVDVTEKLKGDFINPFYYNGAWYASTVIWNDKNCKTGTVCIYDSNLNCVKKCDFKNDMENKYNYPPMVGTCCIDDGKIYIYLMLNGK
ncbi:MAG: hypothetical protein IK002_01180 [Treponema sp.]|uniref:hypothetical protein n=1 Tax=Treponema sp. TaxID=166 RepID=UPI00298E569A|nr:hypothetical protein [Treponema sp.]MBR5932577.1 hypothetical protein [Treponema sp.]